jgi:class 3 adenylate cyclase
MSMGSIFGYGTFKVIQREELHETKVGSNISSPYEETSFLVESCDATGNETMVYSITDGESEYIKEMREIPQSVKDGATVLELDNHDNIFQTTSTSCNFRLWAIPSNLLANDGISRSLRMEVDKPKYHITMTVVVGSCFGLLLVAFLVYDYFIEKRQAIVINIATKSSAIVDGLFPAQVRDRMLDVEGDKINDKRKEIQRRNSMGDASRSSTVDLFSMDSSKWKRGGNQALQNAIVGPNNISIKQFLAGNEANAELAQQHFSDTPIADLFPNTTVIFADIAGFTAWSSQREPPQVFTLLETLYRSFDEVAGKLKVFKVETIGDSYMAVTGLPIPDQAHAVHMARFAYQCLLKMKNLTAELEAILGPGTSDLTLRVGLHSGAVTAGVLRGQKSRFQLFGDTVNTASRMESTGIREKIQVSQETADLLKAAGKSHWLKPREELVVAKGKGELKTFWLDPTKKKSKSGSIFVKSPKESVSARTPLGNANVPVPFKRRFDDKYIRLIDWNVDVLLHHLARLISCRSRTPPKGSLVRHSSEVALLPTSIDNVAEVIAFPPFDLHSARFRRARPE